MIIPHGFVTPEQEGTPPLQVPVATVLPTISGNTEGSNSTSTTGTWSNSPTSYSRQWQVSANGTSGWTNISGATGTTYAILSGDVGKYIRVSVIASNAAGASAPAYSTGLLVVASDSPWAGVLSSNYASDIRAAYDFRDVSGSALAGIVGPELFCEGLTKVSAGAQFTYGQSQAYSNSTIAVSYPFTVVYYGKTATSTGGDMTIIHTQPTKWVQTSNTNVGVFSRTWQGLNPYNGNDNQSIPHVAATEAYFAAFSFLTNGTVRYAIRKASGNLNGTKPANASAQPFNGYVMFGCGFTNKFKLLTGTLGYALSIQKAFSTEAEMDALYATMPDNFVW